MKEVLTDLEKWFTDRPKWQQEAYKKLLLNEFITESDLLELIELCKAGVDSPKVAEPFHIPKGIINKSIHNNELRIESISEVKGINALAPRNPLVFTGNPLTIVYGQNGAGKSGYIRALKHACGARKPGTLLGNVFGTQIHPQSCKLNYKVGLESKEIMWSPKQGVVEDLSSVHIYDTECGSVFVNDDNEITYEPIVLSSFTKLIEVCEKINISIQQEINNSVSKLPSMPNELLESDGASWYQKLNYKTSDADISKRTDWNPQNDELLVSLRKRLLERDPAGRATQLKKATLNAQSILNILNAFTNKLSDENCSSFFVAKQDAISKRKVASDDAKKIFENSPLDGIGSDSWKLLWEQARKYSENVAYVNTAFPNTSDGALCVLCQQPLSDTAKESFRSFESFVKGELEKQAITAEELLKSLEEEFATFPKAEELNMMLDLGGIIEENQRVSILSLFFKLQTRITSLLSIENLSDLIPMPEDNVTVSLKNITQSFQEQAATYEQDAKSDSTISLKKELQELETQKWLAQQKPNIQEEKSRLSKIAKLEAAKKLTNTTALSAKKSDLSSALITQAYIQRFEKELKELCNSRIQVELVKSKSLKGHVFHKIKLKNCDTKITTSEILSEGEFRIVSLASFLANVEGQVQKSPFVFDDPISSLDQDYEEATVSRLAELCKTRQVIVFTHRLSMIALLEEAVEKYSLGYDLICLRRETWGNGEPGETPINVKNTKSALNSLKNQRISKANKIYHEYGRNEYDLIAKGICSDLRIILERIIESDLIADVVKRFRRSINTLGKLNKLSLITNDDCEFIDAFMSKYSKFEHSHSVELPVSLPEPEELNNDVDEILSWLTAFKKRQENA